MAKHVHAELMMQYAQDAMETDKPWERWEYQAESMQEGDFWSDCSLNPSFDKNYNYRRKPERIGVYLNNGDVVSWPEPYTGALLLGTSYWSLGLTEVRHHTWSNSHIEQLVKEQGLLYLVKEDAKEALVARQLIFTQGM